MERATVHTSHPQVTKGRQRGWPNPGTYEVWFEGKWRVVVDRVNLPGYIKYMGKRVSVTFWDDQNESNQNLAVQ